VTKRAHVGDRHVDIDRRQLVARSDVGGGAANNRRDACEAGERLKCCGAAIFDPADPRRKADADDFRPERELEANREAQCQQPIHESRWLNRSEPRCGRTAIRIVDVPWSSHVHISKTRHTTKAEPKNEDRCSVLLFFNSAPDLVRTSDRVHQGTPVQGVGVAVFPVELQDVSRTLTKLTLLKIIEKRSDCAITLIFAEAREAGNMGRMRYAIVIERGPRSFGATVPDLPGCVAVGETLEDVQTLIREAIDLHLAGMREDGQAIPEPSTIVGYVEPE
jgi:predicted RNase H-like HicB family nuclease